VLVEHLMVHLILGDIKLKYLVHVSLLKLLGIYLRCSGLEVESALSELRLKLALEHHLIYLVEFLFDFFSAPDVLQDM
jgi:hypothetical protein